MKKYRRFTSSALAVMILLSICSTFSFPVSAQSRTVRSYYLGDANMSGTVNTADATCILKYSAQMIDLTETQLKLADVNKDEKVNTADASYILKIAAGMITLPDETVDVEDSETPEPTTEPTAEPTTEPTTEPTAEPTMEPTTEPTATPTAEPTTEPTATPTAEPTNEPTATPTAEPTMPPEGDESIVFEGDKIVTANAGCVVSGTEITITAAGEYKVTGTLNDGRIIVDVTKDDEVDFIFTDVNITCSYDAPVYVKSADKVKIALNDNNVITLSGGFASGSECKGAFHSNDDVTINGSGTLTVTAATGNGIHCKDDLKITAGTISVTANAGHALRGNDSVTIKNTANVTLQAGKDGIQTDNTEDEDKGFIEITTSGTVKIAAADDALQADRLITVKSATVNVVSAAKAFNSNGDITIAGGSVNVTKTSEDAMNAQGTLTVSGGEITVTEAGQDGMQGDAAVYVTDGTIRMLKTGAQITSDTSGKGIKSAALIDISDGTIDLTTYEDAIHCDGDIVLSGGEFTVKASAGDCIAADNTVVITGGTFNLTTTTQNADLSLKGIKGTTSVTISDAVMTINTTDDAIHSDGTVTVNSGILNLTSKDDGIHGDQYLYIHGGEITIPSSYEGLESANITISGGTTYLVASDDGINAADGSSSGGGFPGPGGPGGPGGGGPGGGGNSNCIITITGGTTVVNSNGDGIDSNGSITMTGGILAVSGATNNGNGALDYDGKFNMTGGTVIACGMRGMAQTVTSSNVSSVHFQTNSNQSGGAMLVVKDAGGNIVLAFRPAKQYNDIVIATDAFTANAQYDLYSGGTYSGGTDIGGWCSGGTYSGGTKKSTFKPSTSCPRYTY